MKHLVTVCDSNYLLKALTLYESLVRHSGNQEFILWVGCLDQECFKTLNKHFAANLRPIAFYTEWSGPIYMNTPIFTEYIQRIHNVSVMYLDADLFFYGDVQVLYDEMKLGRFYAL